jgi:hypothetical protein
MANSLSTKVNTLDEFNPLATRASQLDWPDEPASTLTATSSAAARLDSFPSSDVTMMTTDKESAWRQDSPAAGRKAISAMELSANNDEDTWNSFESFESSIHQTESGGVEQSSTFSTSSTAESLSGVPLSTTDESAAADVPSGQIALGAPDTTGQIPISSPTPSITEAREAADMPSSLGLVSILHSDDDDNYHSVKTMMMSGKGGKAGMMKSGSNIGGGGNSTDDDYYSDDSYGKSSASMARLGKLEERVAHTWVITRMMTIMMMTSIRMTTIMESRRRQ